MKPLQYETLLKLQDIKNAISQESPEEVELHLNGLEKSLDPYEYQYLLKLINIKTAIENGDFCGGGEFPSTWHSSGTMAQLIADINSDEEATIGNTYMKTVTLSDLPADLTQGELRVDIMEDDATLGKVLLFTLTSNNTSPYHWEYTSAYRADGVWHSFATSEQGNRADNAVPYPRVPGTAGQVLALDAQGNPVWVDAATGGTYDSVMSDSSSNAVQNKAVKEYVDDNFAKKDGSYDALTVGMAKNVEGKNSLEGTFLFRTTAGDADVASGPATVEKGKGNAVAFNQLANMASVESFGGLTVTISNGKITINGTTVSSVAALMGNIGTSSIVGHKYLRGMNIISGSASGTWTIYDGTGDGTATITNGVSRVYVATQTTRYLYFSCAAGVTFDNLTFAPQLSDLTLMGIDSFSTVAQVESWLAANVGNKPYFPAGSKLLPTKLLGLKTRGFNQWDEEWELGSYSTTTGEPLASNDRIRGKNYIPVLPNTTYCFKGNAGVYPEVQVYDANKNFIRNISLNVGTETFNPGENANYIRFYLSSAYGTTYNNDICINISWDGSRNGEYEPYDEREYNFDVTKFYGKLNGEGDFVQIFPNGMKKADYAGTVRDLLDLVNAGADVKVEKVDLGGLSSWVYGQYEGVNYFQCPVSGLKGAEPTSVANLICTRYTPRAAATSTGSGNGIATLDSGGTTYIRIFDSSMGSADIVDGVIAKLSGVELFAEAATPLHYTDLVYRDDGVDTPVEALNILVNNWGTEEEIVVAPEASGEPNSCAATLDILYGIDAAEQLDTINQSGILTDSLKANLEALIGVLNMNCSEALGGTIAISDNPTDKVYTFTFTPNAENNG